MSSQRKKRQEIQAAEEDPINVTCGGCKKVFPSKNGSLICPECGYGE